VRAISYTIAKISEQRPAFKGLKNEQMAPNGLSNQWGRPRSRNRDDWAALDPHEMQRIVPGIDRLSDSGHHVVRITFRNPPAVVMLSLLVMGVFPLAAGVIQLVTRWRFAALHQRRRERIRGTQRVDPGGEGVDRVGGIVLVIAVKLIQRKVPDVAVVVKWVDSLGRRLQGEEEIAPNLRYGQETVTSIEDSSHPLAIAAFHKPPMIFIVKSTAIVSSG